MLTILRTLLKWFKGEMEELKPETRFFLYVEIGFWLLAGFVFIIWQPEFLTEQRGVYTREPLVYGVVAMGTLYNAPVSKGPPCETYSEFFDLA